ncbi:23019_t:CDS:1, partial [Gigaspora rosea]
LFSNEDDYNREFLSKIRLYNAAFTFTSLGIKFDRELANSRDGVYTYHIQGIFYHRIGSLLPEYESIPQYLQMYIWNTQYELQYLLNTIPNSNLSPTILQGLKNMLDQVNLYVANFWSSADLPMENIENLVMCIHTNILELDQRTHNAPTVSQVAAI